MSANRRQFLQNTLGTISAGLATPYIFSSSVARELTKADRHVIGCIGTGQRWDAVVQQIRPHGDVVAVCDVDRQHVEAANNKVGGKAEMFEDYRKILDNKKIDVVTIVTPDHWHAKIAVEAMRAGKDVYCEKPLTLTIDEGKQIVKVQKETGRVFQVGTQQRSEMGSMFLKAVALVQSGKLGKIQRVYCFIGSVAPSGEIPQADVPTHLNWDMWCGQAPLAVYRHKADGSRYGKTRCHNEFRWWYEYSGGKLTDWGAHHVDIATWAIGMDHAGPTEVIPVMAKHPVPLKDGVPTLDNAYNVATEFEIRCKFPGDIEMIIRDKPAADGPKVPEGNGIFFEGEKGTLFVSRSSLRGAAVDATKEEPIPPELITKLFKGKKPGNHMANFIECVRDRGEPVSDVYTHHRALTTCHLANIAIRLDRKLQWDAVKEEIVGDVDANKWLTREQRKGYEIIV